MPSLHCHLPPEEEQKMPEQDEVIDLVGDDTAGSTEMEEVGVDEVEGIIRSDGEDEGDDNGSSDDVIHIDDTSSEASSMLNDPSIQPFVPVVSSSDENESEAGRCWTLPSTSRDDFEDMEVSTNAVQQPSRRNVARRSRARRPGLTLKGADDIANL